MALEREAIQRAAEMMLSRRPTVALTGAGVSVESGIPDFRSAGGLWDRFDPMEYATIQAFKASPRKVWTMLHELGDILSRAQPNAGHRALARLERAGVVEAVITQNIDNLHQEGGSGEVVEFHGNGSRLVCLRCQDRFDHKAQGEELFDAEGLPRCPSCQEILKPDVILFGEAIPAEAMERSYELVAQCGLMLIAGTSATVMPCAALPLLARQRGALLIEVNLEPTELTGSADLSLRGRWGEVMPALTDAVLSGLPS